MTIQLTVDESFSLIDSLDEDSVHCAIIDYPWEFEIQNGTGRYEYRRKEGRGDGIGDRDITREARMEKRFSNRSVARPLGSRWRWKGT